MSRRKTNLSDVTRGALSLILGVAGGRAIGILVTPLLTRLYDPSEFAVLSLFVAVVAVLNPLIALRYPAAVPVPRGGLMAINLAAASLLLGVVSIFLIALIIVLEYRWLLSWSALAPLDGVFWLIPISLALNGAFELAGNWTTRRQAFNVLARSLVIQAGNGSIVKLGLGFLNGRAEGLVIGQIVAQGSGTIVQLRSAWPELQPLFGCVSRLGMVRAMRSYWRFPAFQLPSQFLAIGAEQAPIFFIAASFGTLETGSFGMAVTLLTLPVMLIGKSLSRAFYGKVAEIGRRRPCEVLKLTLSVLKKVVLVSTPVSLLLFVYAEPLFPFLLGSDWELAGEVTAYLALMLVGHVMFTAINQVLSVFNRQSMKLWLDTQRALIVTGILLCTHFFGFSFITMIRVYSILMLVHFIISTGWIVLYLSQLVGQHRDVTG